MTGRNWISELPTSPFSLLPEAIIVRMVMQDGGEMLKYFDALRALIRQYNSMILHAKNGDEAAVAEARQKLITQEHEKHLSAVRKTTVNLLMKGVYICSGFLNGENIIVPMRAWSGEIDWEQSTLLYAGQKYCDLRIIIRNLLSAAQQKIIREYASGDTDTRVTRTGAPGRPSSMYIIEAELRRRITENATEHSTRAEAKYLAEWFKHEHPDKPPLNFKTINNNIATLMREHLRVLTTGSEFPQKRA
jgi:hypothetical protein